MLDTRAKEVLAKSAGEEADAEADGGPGECKPLCCFYGGVFPRSWLAG